MYRSIIRRQYRKAWDAMNRHDYEAIIAQLAPTFEVTFVGDTSLGGSRHTKDAMRRWFERLFRLFPDARFELRAVAVDGWPWDTRIFGSFAITATVLGETYDNVFIQFVKMRWGRITSYSIYEDSLKFWRTAQSDGRPRLRRSDCARSSRRGPAECKPDPGSGHLSERCAVAIRFRLVVDGPQAGHFTNSPGLAHSHAGAAEDRA
jgi:ketosteroid isomerase-like protein